jgi:hypothetical protein
MQLFEIIQISGAPIFINPAEVVTVTHVAAPAPGYTTIALSGMPPVQTNEPLPNVVAAINLALHA